MGTIQEDHPKINNCPNCEGTGIIRTFSTCYCMTYLEGGYCQCDGSSEEVCDACMGAPDGTIMIELDIPDQ